VIADTQSTDGEQMASGLERPNKNCGCWGGRIPLFPFVVNFLPIHDDIIWCDNANTHFPAVNCYDLDADVVPDHNFFPDFP
jgi:hypothetical protein